MPNKAPISVVVITKNEEARLDDCLKSVAGWADEIIVVDDDSTDKTTDIAQKYTDRVFRRRMDVEGRHRNWAYAQAKNDWVLSLDADERILDELKPEIDQVLSNPQHVSYTIPRRNYIGDYWVKWGGQYPSAQLRLFRKDKFKYEEVEVHPRVFVEGTTGHLTKDMLHYSYRDFGHFLRKLDGQSTAEAKKMFKSNRKIKFGKYFWRAIDRFFRSYVGKKGYKDGFVGFMVAYFASVYQIVSYAKYWEMKKNQVTK